MRPIREAYIDQMKSRKDSRGDADPYVQSLKRLPWNIKGITGTIRKIRLFPGKALGALLADIVHIGEHGLMTPEGLEDRAFMLGIRNTKAGEEGEPDYLRFSQREQPQLARVQPSCHGKFLSYTADGMSSFRMRFCDLRPRDGTPVTVDVAKDILTAVEEEEDGPITSCIRRYLRNFRTDVQRIRVLFPHATSFRRVEPRHAAGQHGQTRFTDGGQVLLGSTSDLRYLENRIWDNPERGSRMPLMQEYRPNFEVQGWPAHVTDIFAEAVIRGAQENGDEQGIPLFAGDLSVRCKVTKVDTLLGGFFNDSAPWKAITHDRPRRLDGNPIPTFAVNAIFPADTVGAVIRRGDTIEVLREKTVD